MPLGEFWPGDLLLPFCSIEIQFQGEDVFWQCKLSGDHGLLRLCINYSRDKHETWKSWRCVLFCFVFKVFMISFSSSYKERLQILLSWPIIKTLKSSLLVGSFFIQSYVIFGRMRLSCSYRWDNCRLPSELIQRIDTHHVAIKKSCYEEDISPELTTLASRFHFNCSQRDDETDTLLYCHAVWLRFYRDCKKWECCSEK